MTYELPTTCSHTAQWSSLLPPDGNHVWGADAKMTNPATAAIHATLERRRHPMLARASTASSPHTQWCCQEIGEISSAARPLSASAKQDSPAANAFLMARLTRTRTTAESSSHRPVPAGVPVSRWARASTPVMLWLLEYHALPMRPVSKTMPVQ